MINKTKLYFHYILFVVAIFIFSERMNIRKRTTTCSTDKFTESSLAMIIFGVQGIIFPLELFPRFILHRASSPFCSRYIFSSPLLIHLAVQGRNLLETSFLSTSSPLRLPFNLFLRPFLRLRFRSSRPSSSSWIFSPDLFLMHSNFFDLILSPSNLFALFSPNFPSKFYYCSSFPFHLRSFSSVFTFNCLPLREFNIFLSLYFFLFSHFSFLPSYNLCIMLCIMLCSTIFSYYFFFSWYKFYFLSSYLWIILISFSYFTFGRSFYQLRLPYSFLLPHVYILFLGVSFLKCRALQASQSHLVIQLSEVEEDEYPFSLLLQILSAPSTCNHRGGRSLQSERSEKCC